MFVFKEGVQELIEAELELRNHTEESLLFGNVAQICLYEMFNARFKGKIDAKNVMTPKVNWLLLLIMYGESRETQKCNIISQLLIFNSKKKQKSPPNKERHMIEMPIPLYIGMMIHTMTHLGS